MDDLATFAVRNVDTKTIKDLLEGRTLEDGVADGR